MPKVMLVTTGGTIASRYDPAVDAIVAAVSGAQLLAMVPGLDEVAQVDLREFSLVPGWSITPEMMLDLCKILDEILASPDYSGAVVAHGTDMIEETAYFLDLTLKTDKPVVVAGAMHNTSDPDPDGPRNLKSAVTVAASPEAVGLGAMVVLNDQIHAAREAVKMHTTNVATFESPQAGPLGFIIMGRPIFLRRPFKRDRIPTDRINSAVDLIKTASGMDGRMVQHAVADGAAGLVIEGTGTGNVPGKMAPALYEALKLGLPVVLTSRCLKGSVAPIYGREGGAKLMVDAGAIIGGTLTGVKARLKLMVALGITTDLAEIRRMFEES
jgi:L-asparaginase